ncbi:Alpha/Beta hydrolase protein [Haematococcus lacustris]
MSPATASQEPGISTHQLVAACLPAALSAAGWSYSGFADGLDTNLLLLFHGLGDRHTPYAALAAKLALPQTASLALGGPLEVPESDGGRAWFVTHEEEGWEPIQPRPGETRRLRSLARTARLVSELLRRLVDSGRWRYNQLSLFGFSQGGTLALEVATQHRGSQALAGVVSIAGPLLEESLQQQHPMRSGPSSAASRPSATLTLPPDPKQGKEGQEAGERMGGGGGSCREGAWTSMLLTRGTEDTVCSAAAAEQTYNCLRNHHGNLDAVIISVANKAHSMLGGSQEEVRRVMQFWARTLKVAPPVSGALELSA